MARDEKSVESFKVWDWERFMTTLSVSDQKRFGQLDSSIRDVWELGRNLVLAWTLDGSAIDVIHLPYYRIPDLHKSLAEGSGERSGTAEARIQGVFSGQNFVDGEDFEAIQQAPGCQRTRLELTFTPRGEGDLAVIRLLMRRYGIMWSRDRAVVLLDIDGFSVLPQLEQVTQINSLSLSLNRAQMHLADRPYGRDFTRSTTGDGFYIWNDAGTVKANVALYHLMHMALAHNAITRGKKKHTTPSLRTCFHIGELFEFFQTDRLAPSLTSYIVGDVTVQLERLSTAARAGQILVGDFSVQPAPGVDAEGFGPVDFVRRLQESLSDLEGVLLGDEEVESIKCYLTGTRNADGTFNINKYEVSDKHGRPHYAFNAKINIYRRSGEPIWLGIEDKELDYLEVAETIPSDQELT